MTPIEPENVPEEDFTTITDVESIYDLFNENKISLAELDRLKAEYFQWYYSEEQHLTVLRFYRQPEGYITIWKQTYVPAFSGNGNGNSDRSIQTREEQLRQEGTLIAEQLGNGVNYVGPFLLDGPEGKFDGHLFQDDAVTQSSFTGMDFEGAKRRFIEMREQWGVEPPVFEVE